MRATLSRRRPLAGFTLIELLIVIIIIGILVAIGVPAYLKYTAAANDRDAQAALQVAYKAALAGDTEVNSGRFPVSSTVVSDIKQDEPAAAVVSGSCIGTVAQAPAKQVIVDTASTSSALTLCTRSASGAIWKLSGPLTGTPTVGDGSTVTLAATGGTLFTDAVRTAGLTGEAFAPPSSTGIYQPTTNLLWNSGAEVGLANIGGVTGTSAVVRDTVHHKYGVASVALTSDGTNTGNGAIFNGNAGPGSSFFPVTAGTTYTGQGWGMPNGPDQFDAELWWFDSSGTTLSNSTGTAVPAPGGSWTFASVTAAAPASAAYAQLKLRFSHADGTTKVVSGQTAGWIDGAQTTQSYIALPYVDTTTGPTTRAGGRLQFPSSVVSSTQGWAAFRVYFPWAAAANPDNDQTNMFLKLFHWGDDGTHEIQLYFSEQFHKFGLSRKNSTFTDGSCATAFTAGTTHTVIGAWTATQVGISVDGAPFCWTANNTIPTLAASTFDVGRNAMSSSNWIDADILWMATGTGALVDADAATINSFGDSDKSRAAFPGQPTLFWSGDTTTASLK